MGVSVDPGAASRNQKPLDAELNLIPFIDLLVCCICFLLITAVWVQMAQIPVSQRSRGSGHETLERPPSIAVLVGVEGYTVTLGSERLRIPRQGQAYDTEELGRQLRRLRPWLPGSTRLTLAAEDPIPYRHLVRTMDVALGASYLELQVADAALRL